jgi:hypothetical protein
MNIKKAKIIFLLCFISLQPILFAQEALKSIQEEYYDTLALNGVIQRPTLNYQTLSDSVWDTSNVSSDIWYNNNLGKKQHINDYISYRIYGPSLFSSYNSAVPFGQNDSLLWQGKGLNTSLSGGIRIEGYGFEITFKPEVVYSQNLPFDTLPSNTDSEYGYFWGYGPNVGIDNPQRFGDSAFFDWSFGDSEIRYTLHNWTVGFGTQNIWLGPAYLNPILHSNNAAPYPKVDLGLRKSPFYIPVWNYYLGDIEARIWTGYLTESDYFDNDSSNDHNMLHGLSLAFSPSFIPGLTLSANRTCLVKWKLENLRYILPAKANTYVGVADAGEDQKASLAFSWLFTEVGLELYGEIAKDDYSGAGFIVYPFHSIGYTVGLQKLLDFFPSEKIYGKLNIEINSLEMSQDFQFQWPYSFYFHYQVTQGYTNRGQILGNGYSPGGNSQYVSYSIFYPKGMTKVYIHRFNPDNNYIYKDTIGTENKEDASIKFNSWKTYFIYGFNSSIYIDKNTLLNIGFDIVNIDNLLYYFDNTDISNFHIYFGINYYL